MAIPVILNNPRLDIAENFAMRGKFHLPNMPGMKLTATRP
jgi:hypothetical protein